MKQIRLLLIMSFLLFGGCFAHEEDHLQKPTSTPYTEAMLTQEFIELVKTGLDDAIPDRYISLIDKPLFNGYPAIHFYYEEGDYTSITLLLSRGADIEFRMASGFSLLQEGINNFDFKFIGAILDTGGKISLPDDFIISYLQQISSEKETFSIENYGKTLFILLDQFEDIKKLLDSQIKDETVYSTVLSAYEKKDPSLLKPLIGIARLYDNDWPDLQEDASYPRRYGGEKALTNPVHIDDFYTGDTFGSFEIQTSYHSVFTTLGFQVRFFNGNVPISGTYEKSTNRSVNEWSGGVEIFIDQEHRDIVPIIYAQDQEYPFMGWHYYLSNVNPNSDKYKFIFNGRGRFTGIVNEVARTFYPTSGTAPYIFLKEVEVITIGKVNQDGVYLYDKPVGSRIGVLQKLQEMAALYYSKEFVKKGENEYDHIKQHWIYVEGVTDTSISGWILDDQLDYYIKD